MGLQKFVGLQAFEVTYLGILAVLPWIVVQPIVHKTILSIAAIIILNAIYQKLTFRKVNTDNKFVFITGCDSGFGYATARRLCGEGFSVFAGCFNLESQGAKKLRSEYPKVHLVQLDITDSSSVEKAVNEVNKTVKEKGLWALINNAGVYGVGDVELSPLEEYRRLAEVNLFGFVFVTKQFIPLIRKAKGRIVNVTSNKGRMGVPGNSAFCMTKYGQEGFTDSLRIEMRKFGVKVITVEPGNFTGSTAMLGKNAIKQYETELNKMWQSSSKDVKDTYRKQYVDGLYKSVSEYAAKSGNTVGPVVDTIEIAVVAKNPNVRYLVDGGSGIVDQDNLLIRLGNFLPESIIHYSIDRTYNYGAILTKEKTE